MKYLKFLLVTFLLVHISGCVNFQCGDELNCVVEYNIALGFESEPPIREIFVGDTFTISMEIPHIVEDTETEDQYDLRDLNYSKTFTTILLDLDSKTFKSTPIGNLSYQEISGKGQIRVDQLGDFTEVVRLSLDSFEDRKFISFKVIPKSKGVYSGFISFNDSDLTEYGDKNMFSLTDTCCAERINLRHEYSTSGGKNIDLIPDITNWGEKQEGWDTAIAHKDLDVEDWTKLGTFYFRVLE